jgi:antitoxin PrlF
MKSTVSEKGQVTIPKQLRDSLGIEPGQELDFTEEEGRLVARKVRRQSPVDAVYGTLQLDIGTDELMDELRGPVDIP